MEKEKNQASTKLSVSYEPLVGGERDREKLSFVLNERKKEDREQVIKEILSEVQGSPIRFFKKQLIAEMVKNQEKVGLSDVLSLLKIKAINYGLELMKEVAKENDFILVRGGAWRESYLTSARFEGQNKVVWAFSQAYKSILSQPIGTTKRVSSIAKEFNLNQQELQAVVGLLAQQQEIFIQTSSMGFSERRIKRVR